MNIFGKFTIYKPNSYILVIHRDPGLLFWLFVLMYCGFVTFLNLLFAIMIWETHLPRTLTCQKQEQQTITCDYVIQGFINGKIIKIPNVKKAISSPTPNGETIVLTSSPPWIVLEPTSNNIQNIESINQGLAQLNNGEKIWKLDMYASASVRQFVMFFLLPVGLLLFLLGLRIIVSQGSTNLELDVKTNTVSIINLGRFCSRLSLFNQLIEADSRLAGHLGILSEKFGIYGGDSHYRRKKYRMIRLLFANRRPFILHQQRFNSDGGQELIVAINSFIAQHKA